MLGLVARTAPSLVSKKSPGFWLTRIKLPPYFRMRRAKRMRKRRIGSCSRSRPTSSISKWRGRRSRRSAVQSQLASKRQAGGTSSSLKSRRLNPTIGAPRSTFVGALNSRPRSPVTQRRRMVLTREPGWALSSWRQISPSTGVCSVFEMTDRVIDSTCARSTSSSLPHIRPIKSSTSLS